MTKFTKEKVLLLHQYIAAETGGSVGVRDEGLLESALQSAFTTFDGRELYPTKEERLPASERLLSPTILSLTATSESACM